jgi:hypothetical protein
MARDARVLANQHRRALFVAMKHPSDDMGEMQSEVRRDREIPSPPTDSVGTEILASHIHDDHLCLSTFIERDGFPGSVNYLGNATLSKILKTIDLFFHSFTSKNNPNKNAA